MVGRSMEKNGPDGSLLCPWKADLEAATGWLVLQEKIDTTRARLLAALQTRELREVSIALRATPEEVFSWSLAFWQEHRFPSGVAERLAAAEALFPGTLVAYRFLLLCNSLRSLSGLERWPMDPSVKLLLCNEYQSFAAVAPERLPLFQPAEHSYHVFTGISLRQRFRTGLLDWEESGLPRSWFAKVPPRDLLPMVHYLFSRMGGRRPYWVPHLFFRGENRVLRERDWEASLRRMARSLRLQPHIKGVLTGAWFYSAETHRVSPHLAWTTRTFLENGAFLTHLGEAQPSAGFLQGAKIRQRLYEAGQYRPTETILLWPRDNILQWLEKENSLRRAGEK